MQACHQLHAPIRMALISCRKPVVVAIQFCEASDLSLQSHHLFKGREAIDGAKQLELLQRIAMAFLLNQRLGEVLA